MRTFKDGSVELREGTTKFDGLVGNLSPTGAIGLPVAGIALLAAIAGLSFAIARRNRA